MKKNFKEWLEQQEGMEPPFKDWWERHSAIAEAYAAYCVRIAISEFAEETAKAMEFCQSMEDHSGL